MNRFDQIKALEKQLEAIKGFQVGKVKFRLSFPNLVISEGGSAVSIHQGHIVELRDKLTEIIGDGIPVDEDEENK